MGQSVRYCCPGYMPVGLMGAAAQSDEHRDRDKRARTRHINSHKPLQQNSALRSRCYCAAFYHQMLVIQNAPAMITGQTIWKSPLMTLRLHDFWRSSAAYRVRIALNLKGLAFERVQTDLPAGVHRNEAYLAENPQGFVPMLTAGAQRITQSLAIIEWLDAHHPEPRLIPAEPGMRAAEMARALVIVADIHPVNNLRILHYLKRELGHDQAVIDQWIRHWIDEGFAALERLADPVQPFLSGDAPGLADCCLIPQMYNARRFESDLTPYPRLVAIDARCTALPAFAAAHPDSVR